MKVQLVQVGGEISSPVENSETRLAARGKKNVSGVIYPRVG